MKDLLILWGKLHALDFLAGILGAFLCGIWLLVIAGRMRK